MLITSPHNPRVLQAARLRESRGRRKQNRIIIDGAREIDRAMTAGVKVIELFHCQGDVSLEAARIVDAAKSASVSVLTLASNVFSKLAFGDRNEIIAVAERPYRAFDTVCLLASSLICVVDRVEKPGNLGAILRSADGAGAAAVVASDSICDIYHPNAIRSSLGTVFGLPVCAASSDETLAWLRANSFQIITARPDATTDYSQFNYPARTAIVLGSEASGLDADIWRGDDIHAVRIPMHGVADSLNVSVAAGILMYHARRQLTG